MQALIQLLFQRFVDHAVSFHPGFSVEALTHHHYVEMGILAAVGMPDMEPGEVLHLQDPGDEQSLQFLFYGLCFTHLLTSPRLPYSFAMSAPKKQVGNLSCAHPGCRESGEYPAPVGKRKSDGYKFLCLKHVKAHNRNWDYFAEMSPWQADAFRRRSHLGMNSGWGLGAFAGKKEENRKILEGLYAELRSDAPPGEGEFRWGVPEDVKTAMSVFGISDISSQSRLKMRYRSLVKSNHPDVNGGGKAYIRRLQAINSAYGRLKKWRRQNPQ